MDSKGKWQGFMDWKKRIFGLHGKMTKENWIILLCVGLILMIVAVPFGKTEKGDKPILESSQAPPLETGQETSSVPEYRADTYEALLEKRIKEILAKVEGVGEVDVLIVLKSSEQKIYQTDKKSSQSSTKEQDSSGGVRDIIEQGEESSTVLVNGGGTSLSAGLGSSFSYDGQKTGQANEGSALSSSVNGPLLEMELRPEVAGIIISAQGGDQPSIKSEITAAMEALFGLPAHKIKVLKRVE